MVCFFRPSFSTPVVTPHWVSDLVGGESPANGTGGGSGMRTRRAAWLARVAFAIVDVVLAGGVVATRVDARRVGFLRGGNYERQQLRCALCNRYRPPQTRNPKKRSLFSSYHTGEGTHRRFWPL